MNVAHPDGFRLSDLCAGEDRIMVRYHHAASKFDTYVDVVPAHEWELIPALLGKSCEDQLWSLNSVLRALDEYMAKAILTPHLVTLISRQNFCDDVAIWWIYEFFAGRGADHVIADLADRERIRGLKPALDARFSFAGSRRPTHRTARR